MALRPLLFVSALIPSLYAADNATLRDLKPGDFVRVECKWRNVDKPPTASVCPYVEARDTWGQLMYQRRVANLSRRGFDPDDCSIERWQMNYLVGGGPKPPWDAEVFFTTLPSNTVFMSASVSEKGDPAVRRDVEVTIRKCELKSRGGIGKRPPLEWDGRELTDAEIDAALARREKPRTEVFREGDRTMMRMNGKPFYPRLFKMTKYDTVQRSKLPAAFSEEGFNVFIAPMLVGGRERPETNSVWRQDGSIDMSVIKAELRKYLRWNPNVNIIVNLCFIAPRGWGERNPSECFRNENGDYGHWFHHRIRAYGKTPEPADQKSNHTATPSYASKVWAADMAEAAGKIVSWLETAPEGRAVVGFYFSGGTDGQWLDLFDNGVKPRQMGDYSDVSRRRFAEHLKEKYGTVADAHVPSREELESEERVFYRVHGTSLQSDYRDFMAKSVAEMTLAVASAVKKACGRRLVFGGYFPHGGLSGYPLFSQSASGMLMASPDMDYFAIVPQYDREFCDPIKSASFDGSMSRHGKLFIRELDLRSVDSNQFWGHWKEPFWQEMHSRATFRRKAMHYAADAIVHGGVYHAYDMDGGWFNSSSDRAAWRAVNAMTDYVRAVPSSDEQIALVSGEKYSRFYSSQRGRLLSYPLLEYVPKALQRGGIPWRTYLLDEIMADETAKLPKVVLLSDATAMSAADFAKFRSRFCRDGRVVVYFWRPGLFAADGAAIDRALELKAAPDAEGKTIVCSGKADDPLTRDLSGTFAATYYDFGTDCPEVAAAGGGWKPLLYFDGTKTAGVSVRRGAGCTEVYIALPGAVTAQFCRNLAREAGFEPLVESDELSGCGSGIFYMVAQTSGEKRFRLPKGRKPDEVLAGPKFKVAGSGVYSVKMKIGEIFVLAYR